MNIHHARVLLVAAAPVAALLTGCSRSGGGNAGNSHAASGRPGATTPTTPAPRSATSPSGAGCPIVSSAQLDQIVGMHLTDHFKSTQQPGGGSPFTGSILCDFADSAAGATAKLAYGDVATVGSAQALMQKVQSGVGTGSGRCVPLSGAGEQAFECADAAEAMVVAQDSGHVVMAYRGGKPGGDALLAQATALAKAALHVG